jgi:benzodiazapine receptor
MKKKINISFSKLIINITIPHLAGIIGGYFTASSVKTWYQTLHKPPFNPPNWIFSPIWLTLYTLIGIAFYLFDNKDKFKNTNIYILYLLHIFLNAIWSILFFGMHQVFLALIDILLIITTLIILMKYFYKINKTSFYLLIPYLLWLFFALLLNYSILILN